MEGIKNILAAILVNFPVAVVKMRYLMRFKRLPNLKNPHDLNEKSCIRSYIQIQRCGVDWQTRYWLETMLRTVA